MKGRNTKPGNIILTVTLLVVTTLLGCKKAMPSEPDNDQWVQTNGPYGVDAVCLAVSGTNLFAGCGGAGVFRSTDNGTTWTAVNAGLTPGSITTYYVVALAESGANLLVGTLGAGVFLSTNNGTNWRAANSGLPADAEVYSFAVSPNGAGGTNLFAGASGVFLSTDNGTSWTAVNSGLTNTAVISLAASGDHLFAGLYRGGVFLSTNSGTSWSPTGPGLPADTGVSCLAVIGTNVFAATYGAGVFRSTNNGTSWTAANLGLPSSTLFFVVSGTSLFAASTGGVFRSTNNGTSWAKFGSGFGNYWPIYSLAISSTNLFAGTWQYTNGGVVFRHPL